MDSNELHDIGEALARAILENRNVEATAYHLTRIVSYLKDEQRERLQLTRDMKDFRAAMFGDEQHEGLMHQMKAIEDRSQRNASMLTKVMIGVLTVIAIEALKLVVGQIK